MPHNSETPNPEEACQNRREFLAGAARRAMLAGVAAGMLPLVNACSWFEDAEMRVCTLAELKEAGFKVAEFNGEGIFVALEPETGKPYCLNLTCTHKQCTVKYEPDQQRFECPCHHGRYTREGQVISGKPPAPLHRFWTEVRGEEVFVLNEEVG